VISYLSVQNSQHPTLVSGAVELPYCKCGFTFHYTLHLIKFWNGHCQLVISFSYFVTLQLVLLGVNNEFHAYQSIEIRVLYFKHTHHFLFISKEVILTLIFWVTFIMHFLKSSYSSLQIWFLMFIKWFINIMIDYNHQFLLVSQLSVSLIAIDRNLCLLWELRKNNHLKTGLNFWNKHNTRGGYSLIWAI